MGITTPGQVSFLSPSFPKTGHTSISRSHPSINVAENFPVKYYFCEFLNVVNVVAQYYFTDYFLGNQFNRIALDGLALDEHDAVLPILAECRLNT